MIPFPPPLTISFSPIHIPLLFPFFVYFFHCLLLPLHFPINRSLFLFTNTHHNEEGQTLLFLFSSHIFHSLILWVFKTSRRRRRRLHHHHQPYFSVTITITTLSSQLGLLVVKDSRCGFKIFMLFIRCIST